MKTITTSALKDKLDSVPTALFDVRGDILYEQGHIPGAKTAPLGSLVFRVAGVMNRDSFVAVYGAGDGSGLAREAADRLESLGLTNVHCYVEGLEGWRAAGNTSVPSKQPKLHTQGPVTDCRPIVVDRETAYGGAFRSISSEVGGAGG